MSALNFQRNTIRESFIASSNELEEELNKGEGANINKVKMIWKRTEDRFIKLEPFDNEIWDNLVSFDVTQEEMREEFNDVQVYRDKWSDINCRIDLILQSGDNVVRHNEEPKRYKLPKLKLVEYDGNPKVWLGFWSQFKEIYDDKNLSTEVKFQYLIQTTAEESDARKVVSSFPPTGANYQKAIDHLKSRFGKDKVLIEVYVRELLSLVLSNVKGQQKVPLEKLYDELETQLRALESLGVTTDKYAAMLYPLVESALSEDVLRTWERVRNQRKEVGDVEQLDQLMAFLRMEVERCSQDVPKMLLQEIVKKKIKWDEKVPEEIAKRFKRWLNSIQCLQSLKIPRWVMSPNSRKKSIHVFTDASRGAYSSVAFLRSESDYGIKVELIMSKARVSTIKPISIPKLELIACEMGAKMITNIRDTIDTTDIVTNMWSDSSDALSWIKRNENWQIFVFNRVKKIRELSRPDDWRHIPGSSNPADLPSRGCTAERLLQSRWWEGPIWLRRSEEHWPKSVINCDENVVMGEKKRVVVSHLVQEAESQRYFQYFSQFRKVVRMVAWMRRWRTYKRKQQSEGKRNCQLMKKRKQNCAFGK